ncbi:hypothetical protein MMC17_003986 [Xylographa soralifera]|nr:hypothetical protein [Xylographa soralifera]
MLRLPTTKIDLGPRDLAWHIDRYRQRKAQYEEIRHASESVRSAHQAGQLQSSRVPFRCLPHHQAYVPQATGVVVVDDALVSSEPVPRDSRAFWNGVLAIAGTSMQNSEPLPHERYSDVEATSSSESHHTSIPSDPSSGLDELEVLQQERGRGRNAHDLRDVVEAATRFAELRSQFSADSSQSSENGKEEVTNSFIDLEAGRGATPIRRRAFFNFRRAEHDGGIDEDISNLSRSFSSQLDFGGSNESMRNYDEREEEDLAIARAVPISRSVPRPVLQHTTSRQRGQGSQMEDEEAELAETIASLHELIDGAASPAPRLPAHVEHMRSRSGTIARSPLYLSQAVTSSSPEKPSSISPYHTNLQPGSMTSLLSLPPRRPKQYKPTSKSSISSKASHDSNDTRVPEGKARRSNHTPHPEWETINDLQNTIFNSDGHPTISPSPPSRSHGSSAHSFTSSPPWAPHLSATTIQRSEPPRLPPPSTSLTSANSPSLPPLPPPFSSTRRLVSFNLALPSSSPVHPSPPQTHPPSTSTPHLRNPFHAPSPPSHHPTLPSAPSRSATHLPLPRHYTPSPSPPPPTTPHRSMRIYNDALPALAQPQTPLGLPRHGVYASLGAYTAPVRGNRVYEAREHGNPGHEGRREHGDRVYAAQAHGDSRHGDTGQGDRGHGARAVAAYRVSPWHTTPTRASWLRGGRARGLELDEQENVGVHVEAERRLRVRAEERERREREGVWWGGRRGEDEQEGEGEGGEGGEGGG